MDKIYFSFLKILILLSAIYWYFKIEPDVKKHYLNKIFILLCCFSIILSLFFPYKSLFFQTGIVFICILMFLGRKLYKGNYSIVSYSESLLISINIGYILFVILHLFSVVFYFLIFKNYLLDYYLNWLILILFSILGGVFSEIINEKNFPFNKLIYPLFITFLIGALGFRIEEIELYGKVYFLLKRWGYSLSMIFLFSFVGCKIGERTKTVGKWDKRGV